MKILINEANKELIEKALDGIHTGKESIHVAEFSDIMNAIKIATNKTDKILKKHCKGFRYFYSLNCQKANSYKYSYSADAFTIEWTAKGWCLVHVERRTFFPNQKDLSRFYWELSSEDKEIRHKEVKEHLLEKFLK
jgi:hypothetical protein